MAWLVRALATASVLVAALWAGPAPDARAATVLDVTGCTGAAVVFPTVLPSVSVKTPADCAVSFGSDSGYASLHLYQADGTGTAMGGIGDFQDGVRDWGVGDSMFGACLRSAGADFTAGWPMDSANGCATISSVPWQPIAATQADPGSLLGETAAVATTTTVALQFGLRTSSTQAAGSYSAPLVVEVIEAAPAAPGVLSAPTISGTAAVGSTLAATTGTWSNSPDSYAYQWRRCDATGANCVDIGGATASSYVLTASDVDSTIRVVVTATNLGGSTSSASAQTAATAGASPTAGTVTITGTGTVGQVLSASLSGWTSGTPAGTTSYQWRRCDAAGNSCVNISGATASTYTLVAADVNATIRVVATRSNSCTTGCGTATATSGQTAIVAGIAPTAGTVTISGTSAVGQSLSAALSGWTSGTPAGSDTYQWRRCDAAGNSCVNISGATASTYTLVAADVDATIRVVVTRTNTCTTGCGAATSTSSQTSAVAGVAPVAGTVSVSGTTTVGSALSASLSGWTTGTPTGIDSFQWRRCDSAGDFCADIAGATGSSYTLTSSDVNWTIRVVATRTNTCTSGCGSATATSTQTAIIAGTPPTAGTVSITGTTTTGQTLTAALSGWTTGTPAGTDAYQWRRCDAAGNNCADIAGATSSTYTLVAADVNATVRVVATRTNTCSSGCGSATATSTQTATIAGIAPTAGTVTVTGTPTVGQTLNSSLSGWTNGTPTSTISRQWQRCDAAGNNCTNISGATSTSYTLVAADVNSTIRLVVTRTNTCTTGCGSATATSTATAVVAGTPPTAGTITITGTTTTGQTLTATLSGWTTGTPAGTDAYQWQRCDAAGNNCTNISGATSSSYALTAADVDATIRVAVTRTNGCTSGCGSATATSTQTAAVAGVAPTAGTVTITGTTTTGQTLTASLSGWTSGTPSGTTTYQWQRCDAAGNNCTSISGATNSTYPLVAADVDATIRVAVTRTNTCTAGCGGDSATSSQTAIIAGIAPTAGTVTVSGTAAVGQTLSSSLSGWTAGTPTSTISRQWQRCDTAGNNCVNISGATSTSYTLTSADADATIRLAVTRTNSCTTGCGSATASSAATAAVAGTAPTAGTVSITGTTTTGQTLTATLSGWTTGSPAGTDAYQWRRCDAAGSNCVDIVGATGSTHTLVAADVDATVRVVVTRTNTCTSGCGSATATSGQTAVIAGIAPTAGTVTISGTPTVGQSLSSSLSGWTTGTPTSSISRQWQRCDAAGNNCVNISGATATSYTLVAADVDATIRLVVTRTNTCTTGCGSATATSAATAVIAGTAPTAGTVSITGTTTTGQTLTASLSGWTTGTPTGTTAYQWRRCDAAGANCVDIVGATGSTYALTPTDVNATIRVAVSRTNTCTTGCGTATASSSQTAVIAGIAPTAGTLGITGTTTTGQTLTATLTSWTTGTPAGTTTYQWRRCDSAGANCVNISGATGSTYTLVAGDVNSTIRVYVTRSNTCTIGCGSVSATSSQTAVIAGIAPTAGTVTITGTAASGSVLSASLSGWTTGTPTATTTYQWRRCDAAGANCVNISGATSSTYTVASGDMGSTLRVYVTRSNTCTTGCGSVNATSAQTDVVLGPPPTLWLTTGFEHGTIATNGSGIFDTVEGTGTVSISSATRRNGVYSLRLAPTTSQQARPMWSLPAGTRTFTTRWAVYIETMPPTGQFWGSVMMSNGGRTARLWITSGGVLELDQHNGSAVIGKVTGPTLTTGRWYLIELYANTSTTTWRSRLRVDGVEYPESAGSGTAMDMTEYSIGTTNLRAGTWYVDDVGISLQAADYPLGNAKVLSYKPNATGTHDTPGSFGYSTNNGGGFTTLTTADNNATPGSAARINTWPATITASSNLLRQTTFTASDYLEFQLSDTAETLRPNGVSIVGAHREAATGVNNVNLTAELSGATTSLYSGDPAGGTGSLYYYRSVMTAPPGPSTAWSIADFNALRLRLDSTDATPNVWTDALIAEVDFPVP